MNINRMLAFALVGVLAMSGCVSIETLEKDLKSTDSKKQSAAKQNMVEIVTKAKVDFSTFSTKDRLWCAKKTTDKDDILNAIEQMSNCRQYSSSSGFSKEEIVAYMGMASDENAPIVEALLGNLGFDKSALDILGRGDIEYAVQVFGVVAKYAEGYIGSINDMDILNDMMGKYENWRRGSGRGKNLQERLYEQIIPKRMIALIKTGKDLRKLLDGYKARGKAVDDEVMRLAISQLKGPQGVAQVLIDYEYDVRLCSMLKSHIAKTPSLKGKVALPRYANGSGSVSWSLGDVKIRTSVYSAKDTTFNDGKYVVLLCKKTGDNYFREEVAFKSLNDLEYALNQVSNFLARAAEWQKIAVDKDIANMTKDDDKTRVALDKERRRIENFTFKTSRTDSGKLECRIFVRFEKSVPNLGYFRSFESDATVDDYIKHIEKAYAAVGAFKADVRRREAEAKKRTETADVFN